MSCLQNFLVYLATTNYRGLRKAFSHNNTLFLPTLTSNLALQIINDMQLTTYTLIIVYQ